MIDAKQFFSSTLATVDAVINNFVSVAYTNLVQENAGLITLLFTFYIMMIGYRFVTYSSDSNLSSLTRQLVVMLCVYGMIMSWHLYHLFVYNIFTNEPSHIAKVLINSAGKYRSDVSIAIALDGIYEAVINATVEFFGQVNFSSSGLAFVFYGGLVFAIGSTMCVVVLLLFIYAKMMMAISLALGPIFISFILWASTRDMFAAWLRKLVTLALIPIVTSAIMALMLSVIEVTLPNIARPVESLHFQGIAPFLGLSLATALILSQVMTICSSLGGGISLASMSRGLEIAKLSIEKSGIGAASRKAAYWGAKKVNKPVNRFQRG